MHSRCVTLFLTCLAFISAFRVYQCKQETANDIFLERVYSRSLGGKQPNANKDLSALLRVSPKSLNPLNTTNPDLIGQPVNPSIGGASQEVIGPQQVISYFDGFLANMRYGNSIIAALSSQSLLAKVNPATNIKPLTPEKIIERSREDGAGRSLLEFVGVSNETEYTSKLADIRQMKRDREAIALVSTPSSMLFAFVALLFDPLTLMPFLIAIACVLNAAPQKGHYKFE